MAELFFQHEKNTYLFDTKLLKLFRLAGNQSVEIDGKKLIINEDGCIRIPHKDMHLFFDFMDIAFLYNESMKTLNEGAPDSKDTDRIVK